jgi:hypothetical protein
MRQAYRQLRAPAMFSSGGNFFRVKIGLAKQKNLLFNGARPDRDHQSD